MTVEVTTAEIASSLSGTCYLLGYTGNTFQRYSPSLLVGNGATGKLAQYTASGLLEDSGVASSAVLLSSGSYSDPAWLTALAASKVTGTLPITAGGTGQATAAAALGALLPAQTGQGGKVLGTDGSSAGWVSSASATPGGSSGQIQWNNAGAFAGASALKTDGSSLLIGTGTVSVGTSGAGVLVLGNSTAPTSAPADEVQLFSADYTAGDARLRVLSESGTGLWVGNGTLEAEAPASGAGNSLTLQASNAVSGNTNGGDLILQLAAKSGSGADGKFIIRHATASPSTNVVEIQRQSDLFALLRVLGSSGRIINNGGYFTLNNGGFDGVSLVPDTGNPLTVGAASGTLVLRGSVVRMSGNRILSAETPGSGAGNSITIQASAAASGNTNGGDLILQLAAKSGSGIDGKLIVRAATASPGGSLTEWQDSSSAALALVNSSGHGWFQTKLRVGTTSSDFAGTESIKAAGTITAAHIYPNTYGLTAIGSGTTIISAINTSELLINGRESSAPNSVHIRGGNQNGADNSNGGKLYLYGGDAGVSSAINTTGGSVYVFGGNKTPASGGSDGDVHLGFNGTTARGNVVVGGAALSTSATDGFFYIPTCAGTPTGTPTTYTGRSPIVYDTTNNKLYVYAGGSWKSATLT